MARPRWSVLLAAIALAGCHCGAVAGRTCTPETADAVCARDGRNCGSYVANSAQCPGQQIAVDCGQCAPGQTCGEGGMPNVCGGCVPQDPQPICAAAGANCGWLPVEPQCKGQPPTVYCGTCAAPETCGGDGTANRCGMPPTCSTGGRWVSLNPGLSPFFTQFWGANADDVWAVGPKPGFAHWNGLGVWSYVEAPGSDGALPSAISGLSASDIWAVGTGIFHYDGQRWSRVAVDIELPKLVAVASVAPNDVWACGRTSILHYDGVRWSVAHSTSDNLSDISASDSNNVWAVTRNGLAVHFDGTTWTETRVPGLKQSGKEVVAPHILTVRRDLTWVSGPGADPDVLLRFDGDAWHEEVTYGGGTTGAHGRLLGTLDNGVFVACPFMQWTGREFDSVFGPPHDDWCAVDLSPIGGDALWAAMYGESSEITSIMRLPRDDSRLVPLGDSFTGDIFDSVWMADPNDVWACGRDKAWHFNGREWSQLLGWPSCEVVWGSARDDVWFGGGSGLHHWKNGVLEVVPTTATIFDSSWGSGPNDVWFASQSPLLVHWDGSQIVELTPDTAIFEYLDISGSGPNDVWAIGLSTDHLPSIDEAILHWNGTAWTRVDPPGWPDHYCGPKHLWSSGSGDTVLTSYAFPPQHWTGTGWEPVAPDDDEGHDTSLCTGDALWLHWGWSPHEFDQWRPSGWRPAGPAVSYPVNGCHVKNGYGWALGPSGVILRMCP